MTMRPFFSYYGGKYKIAKEYPKPRYSKIIEPFAGSAGYSLRYSTADIVLYDIDPVIAGLWEYLIRSSKHDIEQLPLEVEHTDNLNVCQEAKWLIGFWINQGSSEPHHQPSAWMRNNLRPNSWWGLAIRTRIAEQVDRIRHWKVAHKSYEHIANESATWFIDPPYQGRYGRNYVHNNVDYFRLSEYCPNRQGQVIVCEQSGANWLPFSPFRKIKGQVRYSDEVIWHREPT